MHGGFDNIRLGNANGAQSNRQSWSINAHCSTPLR
jgi:hypothetical protein